MRRREQRHLHKSECQHRWNDRHRPADREQCAGANQQCDMDRQALHSCRVAAS